MHYFKNCHNHLKFYQIFIYFSPSVCPQFPYSKIIPILLVYDAFNHVLFQSASARSWHILKKYERQVNPCIFKTLNSNMCTLKLRLYDGSINSLGFQIKGTDFCIQTKIRLIMTVPYNLDAEVICFCSSLYYFQSCTCFHCKIFREVFSFLLIGVFLRNVFDIALPFFNMLTNKIGQ